MKDVMALAGSAFKPGQHHDGSSVLFGFRCGNMYTGEHKLMTETLSIRIDAETKRRLEALSKRSQRSKSFLAAEAIAAYVDSEGWQLGEIQAGITEIDAGKEVSHEQVSKWLRSWGKPREGKAPR